MSEPLWRVTLTIDTVLSGPTAEEAERQVMAIVSDHGIEIGPFGSIVPFEIRDVKTEETREEDWPRV